MIKILKKFHVYSEKKNKGVQVLVEFEAQKCLSCLKKSEQC